MATQPAFSSVAAAHPVETIDTAPPQLQIKRLTATALLPTKGSAFAAGHDLYASEPLTIPPGGRALVSTGISMAIPAGCYGRVAPRSGLAVKAGIQTGAGVIDADYRGEVKVLLFNHGQADFEVKHGERIAQLILERCLMTDVVETEELSETVRGVGGFGSTGMSA
jgi:dUTP pyrophosphatase